MADITHPSPSSVDTPFLALDPVRLDRNIARLQARMDALGVVLRPHLKTAKSADVARRLYVGGTGPTTVSTLKEAEYFAEAGFRDLLYAVGIAPDKLPRVLALRERGVDLCIILDSVEQAQAVVAASRTSGRPLPAMIEIDVDGHRGGLVPDNSAILEIAGILHRGAELRGVLTHAGESYGCRSEEALVAAAENERAKTVAAAERIRAAGLPCPVVSVGSTPTSHFARDLAGVTEVRAGVYMFFDLVMAGIGVCAVDDIAATVVATVIGHRREKGWILVDAGWMAMSRDRGTARQPVDQGYGLVAAMDGTLFEDLLMVEASQEHGTLAIRPGSAARLPELPVGTRVRIYPNHACATAAQYDRYHVLETGSDRIAATWPRIQGW
jgi:D-serine deaminase-like pyridoxal phosphate-dependent protein